MTVNDGFTGTLTAAADGKSYAATRQTDTKYLIEIPNVYPHHLSHKFGITIKTENGSLTLTGSGLSYVRTMLTKANGDATIQNAAIALYRYSKAANDVKSSGK